MTRWMSRLVRLYPRSWRDRYEDELTTLIDESDPDWRTALDVVRGATLMQLAYGLSTVRQQSRRLVATPVFTLTVLVTMAAAIGANSLIFSLVNGLLLTPLPHPAPDRLVGVAHRAPGFTADVLPQGAFTYFTYREAARQIEDIGLWTSGMVSVAERGDLSLIHI